MNAILKELLESRDEKYREFHSALLPGIDNVIGVRLPRIREIAKKYVSTDIGRELMDTLPHSYYEENMTHALMIGLLKTDRDCIENRIKKFTPYINNWGVCDSFVASLKYYFKDREKGLELIESEIENGGEYHIRFALVALLNYYLDEEYIDKALDIAVSVKNDAYYVKMAQAWLVSVGIVKQYEKTVVLLKEGCLSPWVHNKAIQKSGESLRLSSDRKEYLNTLRVREK